MSNLNYDLLFRLSRLGLSITLGLTLLIGLLLVLKLPLTIAKVRAAILPSEVNPLLTETGKRGKPTYFAQSPQGEDVTHSAIEVLSTQVPTTTSLLIPTQGTLLGAYIGDLPNTYDKTVKEIQTFEKMTGRRLAILHRFWSMTISTTSQYADFDWLELNKHYDDGRIVMISWNPVSATEKISVTSITYQKIISGFYDYVIRSAAKDAAAFGRPLFIRWSWEMDGDWYAHSGPNAFGPEGVQSWQIVTDTLGHFGDSNKADGPERFVAAWRHIRKIFKEEGATNVIWVWSPNWLSSPIPTSGLITSTWNILDAYYPGDDQVDWIGTSIYYREDNGNERLSFPEMFEHQRSIGPSVAKFAEQHQKPVIIAEIGATEKAGDPQAKAQWIRQTYGIDVKAFPAIKAILWFSVIKEEESGNLLDWRINSSNESLNAFKVAISDTYYLDRFCLPRLFLPITRSS